MIFERARLDDMPRILEIYEGARQFMKETGNPNQWKNTDPSKEELLEDIELERLFVVKEDGIIEGAFMFSTRPDPTYATIYGGEWLNNGSYGVLHRVASSGKIPKFTDRIFEWAAQFVPNLRIDTHQDNKVMQNAVTRNGFKYCGIIYLLNGEERLAYQKVIEPLI